MGLSAVPVVERGCLKSSAPIASVMKTQHTRSKNQFLFETLCGQSKAGQVTQLLLPSAGTAAGL